MSRTEKRKEKDVGLETSHVMASVLVTAAEHIAGDQLQRKLTAGGWSGGRNVANDDRHLALVKDKEENKDVNQR
jgi:hypothetical protein